MCFHEDFDDIDLMDHVHCGTWEMLGVVERSSTLRYSWSLLDQFWIVFSFFPFSGTMTRPRPSGWSLGGCQGPNHGTSCDGSPLFSAAYRGHEDRGSPEMSHFVRRFELWNDSTLLTGTNISIILYIKFKYR